MQNLIILLVLLIIIFIFIWIYSLIKNIIIRIKLHKRELYLEWWIKLIEEARELKKVEAIYHLYKWIKFSNKERELQSKILQMLGEFVMEVIGSQTQQYDKISFVLPKEERWKYENKIRSSKIKSNELEEIIKGLLNYIIDEKKLEKLWYKKRF